MSELPPAIDPEDLYGIWKLVSSSAVDRDGVAIADPWGPSPKGTLLIERSGWMMAQLVDAGPNPPAGATRTYSSYCGRYVVKGNMLTTTIEGASDPSRIGSPQPRVLSWRNGLLVLAPPRRDDGSQRELAWERIAPEPRQ